MAFILLAIGLYRTYSQWPIQRAPGVLISATPEQGPLIENPRPVKYKNVVIDLLATFHLQARILSTERYWFDPMAKISPIDLAVGWGPMSDSQNIQNLDISQNNRFYFYSWKDQAPLDAQSIALHSANMHIIPANDFVKNTILKLRPGSLVNLHGYLARVNTREGGEWKSSLTREDSGNGACEIIYVESARAY